MTDGLRDSGSDDALEEAVNALLDVVRELHRAGRHHEANELARLACSVDALSERLFGNPVAGSPGDGLSPSHE